jgi:hypothetical protein
LELYVLILASDCVALAAARSRRRVGPALGLGLLQCWFLDQQALALVTMPSAAEPHYDGR